MQASPGYGCCGCCDDEDGDTGGGNDAAEHTNDGNGDGDSDEHTAHTDEGDSDVFGTFLKEKWAPLVLHPVGKAVILVAFAGLFGMFAYFATLTTVAQSPKEITPPGSYLIETVAQSEKHVCPNSALPTSPSHYYFFFWDISRKLIVIL